MTKTQKIINLIEELSVLHSKKEIYDKIVAKFGLSRKAASAYYLKATNKGVERIPKAEYTEKEVKKILRQEGENLHISVNVDFDVRTLEDLLQACEVDGAKWDVLSWQCKKWDLGIKNNEEKIETKQLFSVAAKFRPKKLDTDLNLQKAFLLKELFAAAPVDTVEYDVYEKPGKYLLELALFDVHFGKLAHREECGDDYDIKIAAERYKAAIEYFLQAVNIDQIDRILLPVGNDIINVDNKQGTTTGGTQQDTDSRFYKIVRTVKDLLIETINALKEIAPVDVVIVSGNHDEQVCFMIGEMLDAYYNKSKRVSVQNDAAFRKYYKYGTNSIMFTHGDKEKHANLGMIFAAENPKLWAETTQRHVQLGHYHHNKKINYLANEEFQGFQIQIIPSLSSNDSWHTGKGFLSLKQAKAFLYDADDGLFGELTYTAKKSV